MDDQKKILPVKMSDTQSVFSSDVDKLMPKYKDIPDEFKNHSNKWVQLVSTWFFHGLDQNTDFNVKQGIDPKDALKHIMCIMRSFRPKHEEKEAACAYLLSLWFDSVIVPEKKK